MGVFKVWVPSREHLSVQALYDAAIVLYWKSWKGKIPHTWHFLNIRIPKPPYISSLKIIRLLNFLNFLGLSEENYNLQSLWITLYMGHTYRSQIWGELVTLFDSY